jgi:hypothetical protein
MSGVATEGRYAMLGARRRIVVTGAVVTIVIASFTITLARMSGGTGPDPSLSAFTPIAFVYEPAIYRDYAPATSAPADTPTPTATPTGTPTPIPTNARFHLCCYTEMNEACPGCSGYFWLYPGDEWVWESGGLPMEISGTTYEFGIAASSGGSTAFDVELFLMQGTDLLLASTNFTANSSQAERYVRIVQGIDPTVTINQDRLMLRIVNTSGAPGQVYFGDPGQAEAGGSYVEFPQSR